MDCFANFSFRRFCVLIVFKNFEWETARHLATTGFSKMFSLFELYESKGFPQSDKSSEETSKKINSSI